MTNKMVIGYKFALYCFYYLHVWKILEIVILAMWTT